MTSNEAASETWHPDSPTLLPPWPTLEREKGEIPASLPARAWMSTAGILTRESRR